MLPKKRANAGIGQTREERQRHPRISICNRGPFHRRGCGQQTLCPSHIRSARQRVRRRIQQRLKLRILQHGPRWRWIHGPCADFCVQCAGFVRKQLLELPAIDDNGARGWHQAAFDLFEFRRRM